MTKVFRLISRAQSERVALSDVCHIMQQSALVFTHMTALTKHPNESQLMSFLRKIKKLLVAVELGDTLMLPLLVQPRLDTSSAEMMLIVERTAAQQYTFVVVETDSQNCAYHAVTAAEDPLKTQFRTALVLRNVSKKNALDDVFWMAVYWAVWFGFTGGVINE